MIVGPGGVTRLAAPLLNDAAVARASVVRKRIGDLARYADQALRRIPLMPIVSLEPIEVEHALTLPHTLVVVDRSRRVLAAVRRDLPQAECYGCDLAAEPLPVTADVVIAFNIVCRLEDPVAGMVHLEDAVHPHGWLLIDDRSAAAHWPHRAAFDRVAPKTHRRA
ncbi:MAG: hypothetical protein ACE5F9_03245 [Phycisphaerae bacterium]